MTWINRPMYVRLALDRGQRQRWLTNRVLSSSQESPVIFRLPLGQQVRRRNGPRAFEVRISGRLAEKLR